MRDWDPSLYREHTGFVSELGEPLIGLLAPQPDERVLDVGCGDGALTEKLAALGCEVVAIDASPAMVEAARGRGLDARRMDAADLAGEDADVGAFDAVFSNAALHWMRPMAAVARGIHRCLKPGGRFAAELGGEGNVAGLRGAIHEALRRRAVDPTSLDPWYFPSAAEYAGLLDRVGFEVRRIEQFERPTPLTAGIRGWIESVGRPFLHVVEADAREAWLQEVEALMPERLRGEDGIWRADYVRLRLLAARRAA